MTAPTALAPTTGSPKGRTVEFYGSAGVKLQADVYEPASTRAPWSLVICPGYGSIKSLMKTWGETLAAKGFPTCVIGYRGYGQVPDLPGRIFPEEHVDDARSAVAWLQSQSMSEGTRIGVLGVSYGGSIAIKTGALEPGVDAVISIVGYGSGSRHLRSLRRYSEWRDLIDRVEADRSRRVLHGESEQISLDEILLRDPQSQAWRERVESEHPEMRFPLTLESVDKLLEFQPDQELPFRRSIPLLIIHAEHDRVIPLEEADRLFEIASEPKKLVILEGVEHHDVHQGESFQRCIREIEDFLAGVGPSGRDEEDPLNRR